jgi:hypothetical protein
MKTRWQIWQNLIENAMAKKGLFCQCWWWNWEVQANSSNEPYIGRRTPTTCADPGSGKLSTVVKSLSSQITRAFIFTAHSLVVHLQMTRCSWVGGGTLIAVRPRAVCKLCSTCVITPDYLTAALRYAAASTRERSVRSTSWPLRG